MHHLACFWFEAAGMSVLQSGSIHDGTFWYFDTGEELNGVVFETSDRNVRDAPTPAPDETYPPRGDPIDLSS